VRVIKVPRSDYRFFVVTPRKFLRDILNVSGKAEEPFFLHPNKVRKCFEYYDIKNPFDEKLITFDTEWICESLEKPRFMHIDLAQNRCGAGVSSCYVSHIEDVFDSEGKIQKFPFVRFDFVGTVKAERGEEIIIQDIENLIYSLSTKGIRFGLITFDRFQSVHMRQRLLNRGYISAQMSVERCAYKIVLKPPSKNNMDGFVRESTNQQPLSALNCFKDNAYMGLMAIPYHELALNEAIKSGLQKARNKVIALPGMTIDIFHSMAGAVFNLVNNTVIFAETSDEDNERFRDKWYDRDIHRRGDDVDIRKVGAEKNEVAMEDDFYTQDDYAYDVFGY